MIILNTTSDLIQVVTDVGTDLEVHASYMDNNAGVFTPGRTNTPSITSNTTTTIVGSPSLGITRCVDFISLRNNHATDTLSILVQHTDGTNAETLYQATLTAGEVAIMNETGFWATYDVNGGNHQDVSTIRQFGDVGQTTPTNPYGTPMKYVLPDNIRLTLGNCNAWFKANVSGAMSVSYNMTSVTDTGVGIITWAYNDDFDAASSVIVTIERPNTTMTVSELKYIALRLNQKQPFSAQAECWDGTATTAVQEDPAQWHMIAFGRRFFT